MEQLVNTLGFLLPLDVLNKSEHTCLLVILGKHFTDKGIHVETGQGDKLPAVTHRSKVWYKVFEIIFTHLLCIPVEARREVI